MKPMLFQSKLPNIPYYFDDFVTKEIFQWQLQQATQLIHSAPTANVSEDEKAFTIEIAAPGFEKKDFVIRVENGVILVAANTSAMHSVHLLHQEHYYQSFARIFRLPLEKIEQQGVQASFDNGMLRIYFPKKRTATISNSWNIEVK